MQKITVINNRNGKKIGDKIKVACSFFNRLRGLLGRKSLDAGSGLLLSPCSSIHCIGMKFSIDVLFIDKDKKILGIKERLQPSSRANMRGAYFVLELQAGAVEKNDIRVGDVLTFGTNHGSEVEMKI